MKGFVFLLVLLLLFCESTMCSKGLDPLLSNVTESNLQLSMQLYNQTRVCPLSTMLSISSQLSTGPCETSEGLSVFTCTSTFLRSLNVFDVFIKNHRCETDICTFNLDCD